MSSVNESFFVVVVVVVLFFGEPMSLQEWKVTTSKSASFPGSGLIAATSLSLH